MFSRGYLETVFEMQAHLCRVRSCPSAVTYWTEFSTFEAYMGHASLNKVLACMQRWGIIKQMVHCRS